MILPPCLNNTLLPEGDVFIEPTDTVNFSIDEESIEIKDDTIEIQIKLLCN